MSKLHVYIKHLPSRGNCHPVCSKIPGEPKKTKTSTNLRFSENKVPQKIGCFKNLSSFPVFSHRTLPISQNRDRLRADPDPNPAQWRWLWDLIFDGFSMADHQFLPGFE